MSEEVEEVYNKKPSVPKPCIIRVTTPLTFAATTGTPPTDTFYVNFTTRVPLIFAAPRSGWGPPISVRK